MLLKAAGCIVSYWFEQMNYTYKKIWLIAFPVMMSILIEQLINITDALFLGHVGDVELGRICPCRNMVLGNLYARLRVQFGVASGNCPP